MALDGVTLKHLVNELASQLAGARIDKIHQPEKDEVHLLLRLSGQNRRLLLNVNANSARIHITDQTKKNPVSPPMFCMILRKHLEGGKIVSISQSGLERIVTLSVQNYNEAGDLTTYHLHLEIMGKHSNLLLVDPQTNTILDGIKRYSHALSRYREVLPGRPYLQPPSQGKLEPLNDEDKWRNELYKEDLTHTITQILVARFSGISPELAREIAIQAGLNSETHLDQCGEIDLSRLFETYRRLGNPYDFRDIKPCLYFYKAKNNKKGSPSTVAAFSFVPYQQYQDYLTEYPPTLNDAITLFYGYKSSKTNLDSKRGSLSKVVQDHYQHLTKKMAIYRETLSKAEASLSYQRWGELLVANLYRIPPRSEEIVVEDYNEPDLPSIKIPLDKNLSGIENSQRYYRLYNKAKATIQKTTPLKEAVQDELSYLESILFSLSEAADEAELDEVYSELIEQHYIIGKNLDKKQKKGKENKKNKQEVPEPRTFYSSQGRAILVGKNNHQNEWLTLKKGKPADLWLHAKEIPGSHVVIPLEEGEEFPDDKTLEEAAALAIYFSQARDSTLVPVDYTHIRHIKKPKGGKPGMVIYDKNWTLYLTPSPSQLDQLLKSDS